LLDAALQGGINQRSSRAYAYRIARYVVKGPIEADAELGDRAAADARVRFAGC
jgi:hypothetical protein